MNCYNFKKLAAPLNVDQICIVQMTKNEELPSHTTPLFILVLAFRWEMIDNQTIMHGLFS